LDLPAASTDLTSAAGAAEVDALLAHLKTLGWVPSTGKVQGLSSPGEGNMNRTLRVHLRDSSVPSLILKQSVPFVAKYPDIPAPLSRDFSEAAFYCALRRQPLLAAQCPALLGHDPQNHLMCFEDLGTGADFLHLYNEHNKSANASTLSVALAELLTWLGQLHALPAPADFPTNHNMRQLNHEHIFVLPFTANNGLADHPEVAAWQAQFCRNREQKERIHALGQLYLGNPHPLRDPDAQDCLLHGDFYPGSSLQSGKGGQQVHIIDPEFSFVGAPEFDLGVMIAHLTFAGWTPAAITTLLDHYPEPAGYSPAAQFTAVEIMRRLLGVAKLPLNAGANAQLDLLDRAAKLLETA